MKKDKPLDYAFAYSNALCHKHCACKGSPLTQEDRDRLIRLETKKSVDNRLEFMQNLMIGMLAVYGGLCGVFAGLLLWD